MRQFKKFFEKLSRFIFQLSTLFEGIISLIILICIGIEIVALVDKYQIFSMDLSTVQLQSMLSTILWLVIGLEFIKMLLEHSERAVLDVMLFAIARQMVIEHAMLDNLIAVAAIAGVFGIRKFLYNKNEDKESVFAYFLSQMREWEKESGQNKDKEEDKDKDKEDKDRIGEKA